MGDHYDFFFPKGKYKVHIETIYKDYKKDVLSINSNHIRFTSGEDEDTGAIILSSDIAVSHTTYNDNTNDVVWIAYVSEEEGIIKVKYSNDDKKLRWKNYDIGTIQADKVSMAFNSYLYGGENNYYEFITDEKPYIAYIKDNALYILNLNNEIISPYLLAAENVVDISLVRSPKFLNNNIDYGFTAFFLVENNIYYRQLINNTWYDAEIIDIVIENITYKTIEAFVTWDYRTGILITDTNKNLYQIITYPEGIFNQEHHIEISSVLATATLHKISYYDVKETDEHIEITTINATANLLYGYSAVPILVQNIEDSNNNWGTTIEVVFDYPNTIQFVTTAMFTLQDSNGYYYACKTFSLSEDGLTLTLTFSDFNLADKADNMTLVYTMPASGGLMSPAVQTISFSETFIPTGLYNPYEPPIFINAWNSANRMKVYVQFDEIITEGINNDNINHYNLQLHEYNYVPNGVLQNTTRSIASIAEYEGKVLDFNEATLINTMIDKNNITLGVDENG